jgi:hypothetical protein
LAAALWLSALKNWLLFKAIGSMRAFNNYNNNSAGEPQWPREPF